jgi:hypothetical protein
MQRVEIRIGKMGEDIGGSADFSDAGRRVVSDVRIADLLEEYCAIFG